MGRILHNMGLSVSSQELEIKAVHLPGATNRIPGYLSRWHLDSAEYSRLFALECADASIFIEEIVTEVFFILNGDL